MVFTRPANMQTNDYNTILEMLSLIYEDLAVDNVEERFVELVSYVFSFDRIALFFVKHKKKFLQGKLSKGFSPGMVEGMEIPLDERFQFVKPLITGFPVWEEEVDRNDPYVRMLDLHNFALIPMVNKKRMRCWEIVNCLTKDCPAYGKKWLRCWLVSGTKRKGGKEVSLEEKTVICKECKIFADQDFDSVEGVMLVDNSISRTPVSNDVVTMLAIIGHAVGVAINNSKLYLKTLNIAIRDELTGRHNRRYFNERLLDEMERAKRYHEPMSLIMCDIDHFKRINDIYGHPVGDAVLIWTGNLLRNRLRKSDVIARYGGEEFAILLLNTDKNGAMEIAEILRQALEESKYYYRPGLEIKITASFGVVTLDEDANSFEGLINKVDKYLYFAKAQGRNKVCSS